MGSRKGREGDKDWEHSRYSNWRPSYKDDGKPRRRGDTYDPRDRREAYRGSIVGGLLRTVLWIALFLGLIGPGFDYANGMVRPHPAPAKSARLLMLVDCWWSVQAAA